MMSLLQTPADILDEAVLYLQVYFVGFPFLFMYNILSDVYKRQGISSRKSRKQSWCFSVLFAFAVIFCACSYYDLQSVGYICLLYTSNGNGGLSITIPNWNSDNRGYTVKVQAKNGSTVNPDVYKRQELDWWVASQ